MMRISKYFPISILLFVFLSMPIHVGAQSLQDFLKKGNERYRISDLRGALIYYKEGLALAKKLSNNQAVGVFLNSIGSVYTNLGDYQKALSYYEQSLKIRREKGDKHGEGKTLGNIGLIYTDLGDYQKALSYQEQSLKIKREIEDKNGEGNSLNNIGEVYRNLGDYQKAFSYQEQSLKIRRELKDKNGEGDNLGNIGLIYTDLGDYQKALSYQEQSLKITRENGDKKDEGTTLTNIGLIYTDLGDYQKALSYQEQSLRIKRELEDKNGEGNNLGNIGNVHSNLGDYQKALSYFEQALKITRENGDKKGEGNTLGNIGLIYTDLGDYQKALSYFEHGLKIISDIGDKKGEGATLINIGLVYSELGDYPKALFYYDRALKIQKKIGVPTGICEANIGDVYLEQGKTDEAYAIFEKINTPVRLGKYYMSLGDFIKASEEFSRSLKRNETKEMPNADSLLADYIGMGLADEGLKKYEKAKEYFQKGIDLIEKQRGALGGAERERFFEAKVQGFSRLDPYEGMIRTLVKEKGKDAGREALSYAERAKSKIFLEMLASRELKGRTAEDRDILEKEKAFQQEILILRKRMEALERQGEKAPEGELKKLKEEYEQKQEGYERFIKEVKLKNSELSSLLSVEPLSAEKIQSMLDKDTTLLEYYTAKDILYAWLVTKDDVKVYQMPIKENDLRKKVDEMLLPNISNKTRRVEVVKKLYVPDTAAQDTSKDERERNRKNFLEAAKDFYKDIVTPVEKDIKTERLIIVPHGVLHKVPFSTLSDGNKFMLEKYSLSVLPSAGVMEFVEKKRKPDKEKLLVFANPKTDYAPLGFAETEGKAIAGLFPKNKLLSKEDATETYAKDKAYNFNVIHFASHGEFNELQPLQSGLLLAKDDVNDGFLQVHEIFGMDLRSANLVTLSACETALSRVQGGDDLVGLSRGFIYAGTPSILATLWEVDDRSTSILMETFYKNWNKGMSKPEALRQAQIELKKMPEYNHPFYWAPFEMIGDWK